MHSRCHLRPHRDGIYSYPYKKQKHVASHSDSWYKVRRLKQLRTYEVFLDKNGFGPVAGVDEAGRGACAGPISIAACILPSHPIPELESLTDSKQLTEKKRESLFPIIQEKSIAWSILHIPASRIDSLGIQHANVSGMRRVISHLSVEPKFILTDAMKVQGFSEPYLAMIGGDATARCIAAASVLAKVSRDRAMVNLASTYPGYQFEKHKGYGTKVHMDAVRRHGGTPEHRYSYSNVVNAHKEWLKSSSF